MSIPNTLTVYINTRIPGFQKLKYKPSMTVANAGDNVYFDPLVKLSKSTIQSVPVTANENKEKQVASQFFNRGMFETMINRSLSSVFSGQLLDNEGDTLNTKLKKAVEKNVVDENINLTLKTLFRPNSIITIAGKPYTIYSYSWDKGDWKVDTKLYTLNNTVYNASPYGRTQPIVIQNFMGPRAPNDYNRAQGEMKLLDKDVLEGEEFNKKGYVYEPYIELQIKKPDFEKTGVKYGSVENEKDKEIPVGVPVEKYEKSEKQDDMVIKKEGEKKSLFNFVDSLFNKKIKEEPREPRQPEQLKNPQSLQQQLLGPDISVIESKEDEPENNNLLFVEDPQFVKPALLLEENVKDSRSEMKKYKKNESKTWIEDYMNNNNYSVKDNEGNGDCFFAVIRDAFASRGKQTTVEKLRDLISKEATPELFEGYKEHYDMFKNLWNQQQEDLAIYENNPDMTKDDEELIEELKGEIQQTESLLREFSFMEKMNNLDDLREKMKTCDFWADTWVISTLERVLNVKMILLSSEAYKEGDLENVMQCGQMNDPILEQECEFKPDFYIITEYTGNHYKLIGYKGRQLFTYPEIPYALKDLVIRKCMEKNSGLFSLIPEFQKFRNEELGYEGKRRYGLRNIRGGFNAGKDVDEYKDDTNDKEIPLVEARPVNPELIVEDAIRDPNSSENQSETESVKEENLDMKDKNQFALQSETQMKTPSAPISPTQSSPSIRPIQRHINSLFFNDSKLGYFIVIDLELYPGTSIPFNKRPSLGCQIQKERIKQSLAELRGTIYKPSPQNVLYSYNPKNSAESNKSNNPNIKTIKRGGLKKKRTFRNFRKNKKRNTKTKKQRKVKKNTKKNTKK